MDGLDGISAPRTLAYVAQRTWTYVGLRTSAYVVQRMLAYVELRFFNESHALSTLFAATDVVQRVQRCTTLSLLPKTAYNVANVVQRSNVFSARLGNLTLFSALSMRKMFLLCKKRCKFCTFNPFVHYRYFFASVFLGICNRCIPSMIGRQTAGLTSPNVR